MKVIGIVGGVASGKSVVSRELQRLGAVALNVDGFGHDVLRQPEIVSLVVQRWGKEVLDTDGQVIRKKIAAIVFADDGAKELAYLESITHPRISARIAQEIENSRQTDCPALIVDAAVMLKAGWDRHCDVILFVNCPKETRWERAKNRGWTREQFESRELSQTAIDRKRATANIVIDNSGSLDQTYEQVLDFWHSFSP